MKDSWVCEEHQFAAQVDVLRDFLEIMRTFMERYTDNKLLVTRMELALEEMFVNIANYAYLPQNKGFAKVVCAVNPEARLFKFTLIDRGPAFDPRTKLFEDRCPVSADMAPGGLGIQITHELVDRIEYIRSDEQNLLSLIKNY